MNRTVRIVLMALALVAVGAGAFYGGTVYGKSQAQAAIPGGRFIVQQGGAASGQPGQGQRMQMGGGVYGQISEVGDGYVVVTDANGKQTRVQVTDTTLIEKNASVKLSDLTTGETVLVSGSQGSDGTVTARSLQVAPAGRFGGNMPAGTQDGASGNPAGPRNGGPMGGPGFFVAPAPGGGTNP